VYKGLEVLTYSTADRLAQAAAIGVLLAAAGAAHGALAAVHASLAAALAVNYARGSLTAPKTLGLLALAAVGRLWIYWLCFAGRLVDRVLAARAPGLRSFFWANLVLWGVYLAVTPASYYPLPLPPFHPGSHAGLPVAL